MIREESIELAESESLLAELEALERAPRPFVKKAPYKIVRELPRDELGRFTGRKKR